MLLPGNCVPLVVFYCSTMLLLVKNTSDFESFERHPTVKSMQFQTHIQLLMLLKPMVSICMKTLDEWGVGGGGS